MSSFPSWTSGVRIPSPALKLRRVWCKILPPASIGAGRVKQTRAGPCGASRTVRQRHDQLLAVRAAAISAAPLGLRPQLINENQVLGAEPGNLGPPSLALPRHVGPILLGSPHDSCCGMPGTLIARRWVEAPGTRPRRPPCSAGVAAGASRTAPAIRSTWVAQRGRGPCPLIRGCGRTGLAATPLELSDPRGADVIHDRDLTGRDFGVAFGQIARSQVGEKALTVTSPDVDGRESPANRLWCRCAFTQSRLVAAWCCRAPVGPDANEHHGRMRPSS